MKHSRLNILFIVLSLCLCTHMVYAEGEVKIKILAVNPSDTQALQTNVTQYLPEEIRPEDILDNAGMDSHYDAEKRSYYLSAAVDLQPGETKVMQVMVKNVWSISGEEIEQTRSMIEKGLASLKGTKFFETASLLSNKALETLSRIEAEQKSPLATRQSIELYRSHMKQLEDIRNNVFSMTAMNDLKAEKEEGVREAKFMITAQNPSDQQITMTVRSPLPKEIVADDVIEALGFTLLYDKTHERYLLEKQDVFEGKESKEYMIKVKDVWYIPKSQLDYYQQKTEKYSELFKDSAYEVFAKQRSDFIFQALNDIRLLQDEVADSVVLEDRMRAFVLNGQRIELIKKKIRELQDLLPELDLRKADQENIGMIASLFIKKLKDTKDLVLVAVGMQQNKPITWYLFFGIVFFLAIFSIVFYLVWLKKLQENKFQAKPGKETKPPPPQEKQAA